MDEKMKALMKWLKDAVKQKRIREIVIITLVGICVYLIARQEVNAHYKTIKVSGNIEGDDVRLSFRVEGRITELLTDEGEVIKRGDVVALLDTDELVKIRDNAFAALKAEEYQANLARIDYLRAENLLAAGAISVQKRDTFKTKADASLANVEASKAQLDLANTRLGFSELTSSLDGFVLVKSALAGEVVKVGAPVFTAIDLHNIWLTAYVNERDLAKVKFNQPAYVKTDTYPHKVYPGRVSYISQEAEFTPKYIQTNEERVKLVYRIKIRVDNSSLELKPGMPGDGYLIIQS
ncbi:MAG: efflux RND transporter periplasmic adaptor subunit [Candidatus Omnitrophota bacterium]